MSWMLSLLVALPAAPPPAEAGVRAYGTVRLDAIFNSGRFDHPQFPQFVTSEDDAELDLHPRLTRLGVEAWSGPLAGGAATLDGRVEVDFQNGGSESRQVLRLRHAFGRVVTGGLSFLFGQTWQLVAQQLPSANGDSLMWGAGNAGDRAPQVRLGYRVPMGRASLDLDAAAAMPNAVDQKDLDKDGTLDGQAAAMPSLQARIAVSSPLWTERAATLAVAGLWAREAVATPVAGEDAFTQAGVFVELDLPLLEALGVRGEWFMGANLSDVRGGIKQGVNAARGVVVRTQGFWAELHADPTSWLRLAAGYGQDDPEDADLETGERAKNRAAWGVAVLRPVAPLRIGLEYLSWSTSTVGGSSLSVHRAVTWFAYDF